MEDGKIGPIGLYHIDVEGHELESLKGSRLCIEKYKPIICIENFKNPQGDKCKIDSQEEKCVDIREFLKLLNYKPTGYMANEDLIFESMNY